MQVWLRRSCVAVLSPWASSHGEAVHHLCVQRTTWERHATGPQDHRSRIGIKTGTERTEEKGWNRWNMEWTWWNWRILWQWPWNTGKKVVTHGYTINHYYNMLQYVTMFFYHFLSVETVANLLPLQDISLNRLHLKKEWKSNRKRSSKDPTENCKVSSQFSTCTMNLLLIWSRIIVL